MSRCKCLCDLQVLRYLVEFELKESDNPRRLLRRGTCAFSILFKLFSEGLYSAKLFLTATLHEPIMQLLVEDEDHLETDPAKVTERLTPAQQERFGEKGSDGYKQRVQAAVEANEAKLVALVNKFIGYLKQNTYCFPHSLRWIVSQMYKTLSCVERLEVGEVRTMCTDLLLTCFICPAIVNPEQYGIISDAPINEVARFNLMQVGGTEYANTCGTRFPRSRLMLHVPLFCHPGGAAPATVGHGGRRCRSKEEKQFVQI